MPFNTPTCRLIDASEHDAWNAFVAADHSGDLLQSTAWGELKAASSWEPSVIAAFRESRIVGGMMLLRRALPLGKALFYAPRGPVLDWNDAAVVNAVVSTAREYAISRGGIVVKVDPPFEDESAAATLISTGFKPVGGCGGFGGTQPRCVMQLDLQRPLDDIIASFHQKWRYNIRLAAKKGVTIRMSQDRADLPTFYAVLRETARRDGFLVRSQAYFESMWDALVPRGWMRLFLGEAEGDTVCGALTYLFGDKAWYTYGASSNLHREKMPNYLMQWEMIRWAHEQGCRWYDFRGVSCTPDDPDDKTAGLNRFKSGFNPRFVRYIGEFDLPLSGPAYWAFTKALPKARAMMKRTRGRESAEAPE
ncbi:MAG TPA: peptidoglycan bridge formation glycyltransferase FemA/FemB family protein [Armatimonadota bacterium]|jgi:lipid II:glycine glycyltransferase (peptidoglycan interpeptide bridge formation enzyme)